MPRLVQTQQPGLLYLLTSKDGGIGPNSLADEMNASVDALPFLGQNFRARGFRSLTQANINAGISATPRVFSLANATVPLTVPDNQIWRVLGVSFLVSRVTGTPNAKAGWQFGNINDAAFIFPENSSTGSLAAGESGATGFLCDFLATPGSCPILHFEEWSNGVIDASAECHVIFERLSI